MIAFGWVTNMLQRGMASWKRMLEVLDEPSRRSSDAGRDAPTEPAHAADPRRDRDSRNLTFAYGARRPVLEHVSRASRPGRPWRSSAPPDLASRR